jgi:hypothetical protein
VSGGLHTERVDHRALALADGKILITGGINGVGERSNSAELYDPATQRLTATAPMTTARSGHTMTMLNSGKVLVAGGFSDTAELFDPAAGSFTATAGKMSAVRVHHTATLLGDGTVLIAGGAPNSSPAPALQTADLYDPASDSFSPVIQMMQSPRVYHVAALLPGGKALLAGGSDTDDSSGGATNSAEIYDPVAKTFTATANTMSAQRYAAAATTLSDGSILIVDGAAATPFAGSADLFDPATGMFTATTGAPVTARFFHSVVRLLDGTVLVAGGANSTGRLSSSEIYEPAGGTFAPGIPMVYQRSQFTATLLGDGTALIAGGSGTNGFVLPSTEIFVPPPTPTPTPTP